MWFFVIGLAIGIAGAAIVARYRPQWFAAITTIIAVADAKLYPFVPKAPVPVVLVNGSTGPTGSTGPKS